jgi:hypothetical protein
MSIRQPEIIELFLVLSVSNTVLPVYPPVCGLGRIPLTPVASRPIRFLRVPEFEVESTTGVSEALSDR